MGEILERWQYGDPMMVAMRLEAQSCNGCEFERKEKWFGEWRMRCLKDKTHGEKCKQYQIALRAAK